MTRNCSFEGLLCKAGYGTVHKLLGTKMKHLFLAFRGQLDSQQMALVLLQKCGPSTKRFGFFFRLQIRVLRLLQTLILVRLLGLLDFCLLPELETTAASPTKSHLQPCTDSTLGFHGSTREIGCLVKYPTPTRVTPLSTTL